MKEKENTHMTRLCCLRVKDTLPKQFRRVWPVVVVLMLVGFSLISMMASVRMAYASGSTKTVWLQTMDSCRQAIPGASWKLTGKGLKITKGPGPGTGPVSVGTGNCPLQRGNCSTVTAGCLSWSIPIPASGTKTYKIEETTTPAGYASCNGGSVCPDGPEIVTLHINSAGVISATTLNIYPDETSVMYPTSGAPYSGAITDPIVTHNYQLGTGSCDGDNDADDRLTGSPNAHCDSDSDHK